jgi:hypothetical protein
LVYGGVAWGRVWLGLGGRRIAGRGFGGVAEGLEVGGGVVEGF